MTLATGRADQSQLRQILLQGRVQPAEELSDLREQRTDATYEAR
jgi:hypothetical protein